MHSGHRPFLLLSIRGEDEAADDEYLAVLRFAGLDPAGLQRIRLTHQPLGHIDLADWSGVILGGGPYTISDPADTKSAVQQRAEAELLTLIERLVEQDFPFLGCCYGVGTLGTVIGATIDRTYPEPVGGMRITVTAAGRDDPLFADVPDAFDAYGGHKEGVSELPPGVVCLASSPTVRFRPSASARTSTPRSSIPNWTSTGSSPASTSTKTTATSRRNRQRH